MVGDSQPVPSHFPSSVAHVFPKLGWNVGQVQMGVNGRFVGGRQRKGGSIHAFEFSSLVFGNKSEFVQPQASVDGPLPHRNVVLFASCEVSQCERFDALRDQADLCVNGASGFQLLIVVSSNGIQYIWVDVAHGE